MLISWILASENFLSDYNSIKNLYKWPLKGSQKMFKRTDVLQKEILIGLLYLSGECIKTSRKFDSFHTWVKSTSRSPWWDFCPFWPSPPWPLLNVQPQSNVRMMNTLALVLMTKRLDATHMTLACHTRTNMAVQVRKSSMFLSLFSRIDFLALGENPSASILY